MKYDKEIEELFRLSNEEILRLNHEYKIQMDLTLGAIQDAKEHHIKKEGGLHRAYFTCVDIAKEYCKSR